MDEVHTTVIREEFREIIIEIPDECPKEFSTKIWSESLNSLQRFVDPNSLFQQLVEKDLLTLDQQTDFHDKTSFVDRRDLILTAVPGCHHDDFLARFVNCLKETSHENRGHSELIAILADAIEGKRGVFVCSVERNKETISYITHEMPAVSTPESNGRLPQFNIEHKVKTEGFFSKCCSKCWAILYFIAVAVPLLIGIIAMVVLSQTPSVNMSSIRTRHTRDTLTISLDLGISPNWINSFSLSIETCTGRVMVVEGSTCKQLPVTTNFVSMEEASFSSPINVYFLPGSFLNVTARPGASEVFIIQTIETYLAFANQGIGTNLFNCEFPLANVECYSIDSNLQLPIYNITEADFYSAVARPLPFLLHLSYLNVSYDVNAIRRDFNIREYSVGSSDFGTTVTVSPFLDLQEKCVLLSADCSPGPSRAITYQSMSRRQDVLLIPFIVSVIVSIVSVAIVSLIHLLCTREKIFS